MGRSSVRAIGLGFALLAMMVLALWFRAARVTSEPLWLDEAYSAYAAAKGFRFLWHVVPLYETHPPFYYSLLRLWTLGFGDSLVGLRALGLVCGTATLAVLALAARGLARRYPDRFGSGALLIGAVVLLAALNRPLVEMSREVRPYPVMILVYAATTALLMRLGRIAAAESRIDRRAFAGYCACLALMLWLHNLGMLYGAAIGLALLVLVTRRGLSRDDWAWLVGGHVVVALIWLPAVSILADQAPTWVHSTWLHFNRTRIEGDLVLLLAAIGPVARWSAIALLVAGAAALCALREGWRVLLALLLLAIVPIGASLAISVTIAPVFIPRTMTAVAVPAVFLTGIGAAGLVPPWRSLGLGLLAILSSQLVAQNIDARQDNGMQDWYGTIAWLKRHVRSGDQIWAYPNEGALPLAYAARDAEYPIDLRSIPTPIPTLDGGPGAWNPTGSRGVFSLPRTRLRAIVRAPEAERIDTIWLLRLGANAYDVGDVLLGELSHDRVRIARLECGPIDIIGLRRAGPGVTPSSAKAGCAWPDGPPRPRDRRAARAAAAAAR